MSDLAATSVSQATPARPGRLELLTHTDFGHLARIARGATTRKGD
ncbi:hypothetical protein [Streptomyces melanogenes]|nr:hypothetical protein [Streptomyces melanogenes]GGP80005.1 hypothetical protein GCM10010278_68010 [Streptomyces melanogenes]